jgi:hypothetical protein
METKKQIKAQLRNQISKEYKDRIYRAEQECVVARAKLFAEQRLRVKAEEKVASLQEEVDMYKDWVRRLQEFMDMDPETRENEIKKYKEQRAMDNAFEFVANSEFFKMFNQLTGMTLF